MTPPAKRESHPLDCLPVGEWRVLVADFCGCYANVLGGDVLGTALLVGMWRRELALTLDELRAALRGLLRPAAVGRVTHRGELNAALGRAVDEAVRSRRTKEATARYDPPAKPTETESIRSILARRRPLWEPPSPARPAPPSGGTPTAPPSPPAAGSA